ncbi:hypothetical protein RB195_011467 [Necator americanus]|uniref:Uncharacterized protein n=1 Tax=Necator americanus TaxID=51031 RepID=A0ABR1D2H8_NECAM
MRKAIHLGFIVLLLVSIGTVLCQDDGQTGSPEADSKSEAATEGGVVGAESTAVKTSNAPGGEGNIIDKIFKKGAEEEFSTITFLMMSVMAFLL